MSESDIEKVAEQWHLAIPESVRETLDKLQADDEIGVWKLNPALLDVNQLPPGGPVDLFPIGDDGMNDYLCLYPDRFDDEQPLSIVMWSPEARQITYLGPDFPTFLERESHRRLDFLLERGAHLDDASIELARKGESIPLEGVPEENRMIASLIADVCRIAGTLGLSESIFERASGKSGSPDFLREVDGRDEPGIDQAIDELKEMANRGDASAALEVLGFLQVRQKTDEAAKWAFIAAKCSMFSWPDFSIAMLGKLAEILKANAAAIPATERLDPLFSFLTTQPTTKVDGRINLAKQYLRKKDYRSAAREAENALVLAQSLSDAAAASAGMRTAYTLMGDIFRSAGRTREEEYAKLMLSKVPA